jgi:hypothetical protein
MYAGLQAVPAQSASCPQLEHTPAVQIPDAHSAGSRHCSPIARAAAGTHAIGTPRSGGPGSV